MARRDYVRNTAPKRRPANKRAPARKAKTPQSPLPWKAILAFVVLAIAFVYFLVSTKDKAPAQVVPAEPQVVQPDTPSKTDKDSLPPPPEEEWHYVETLKNKEVQVEVPAKAQTVRQYQMQCGSFRSRNQAESMRAKIAFQGLESHIRHKAGSAWYRVVLGPYQGKRPAERDKHKLERAKIISCQIWLWTTP